MVQGKRARHKPRTSVYQQPKLFIIIMNTTIAAVAALLPILPKHYYSAPLEHCIIG